MTKTSLWTDPSIGQNKAFSKNYENFMICYNENEVTSYLDLFEQIWQDIKWEKIIVSLDDSSSDQEHLKLKNYEEDKIDNTLGKASIDYEVIDIDLWNGNTKASFVKASNMSRFKKKSVSFRSKSRVKQSENMWKIGL